MRGNKRDTAEASIIKALRDAGCLVMQLDKFDLLVLPFCFDYTDGRVQWGEPVMMEVKTGKGALKPSQTKLIDAGWPLHVVRTPAEALAVVAWPQP